MFGVNLRFKYPFYAALVGSAIASAFIAVSGVLAPAIGVGGLPAFISIVPGSILSFIVGMVIAIIVPVACTFLFHYVSTKRAKKAALKKAA